jgi:hypothetical protein
VKHYIFSTIIAVCFFSSTQNLEPDAMATIFFDNGIWQEKTWENSMMCYESLVCVFENFFKELMLAEDTQYFSSPSKKYISNPSQLRLKITLLFKKFMQCDLNSNTRGIRCFYYHKLNLMLQNGLKNSCQVLWFHKETSITGMMSKLWFQFEKKVLLCCT